MTMPNVTEQVTRGVAELARLQLSDQEVTTFTHQLGEILVYVNLLQEVDVSSVEPLTNPLLAAVDLVTPLREDRVIPSLMDEAGHPKVLESAPDVLDDGFKVPPIL